VHVVATCRQFVRHAMSAVEPQRRAVMSAVKDDSRRDPTLMAVSVGPLIASQHLPGYSISIIYRNKETVLKSEFLGICDFTRRNTRVETA